ncbi:MAG: CoA-transferase subunit beta [Pigmentiphaga sp.]
MNDQNPTCSTGEMMSVQLARDIRDGEKAIIGTNSDIQLAACNLARLMHAPRLWWISGPGGMANPRNNRLVSTADFENIAVSESWTDLPLTVDFIDWQIHFFDFSILSAIQVDRYGNINTVCVGGHHRPTLRGPGTVGISALTGLSKRFYVVVNRHDRNVFVPRVDFRCGAGFLEGGSSREDYGLPAGGPRWVVTPLGVFDFEPGSKRMRVHALTAGVALDHVRDLTGFDLMVPEHVPISGPPTERELELLRTCIDTDGALQRKFP